MAANSFEFKFNKSLSSNNPIIGFAIAGLILIGLAASYIFSHSVTVGGSSQEGSGVVCTADALECPDGSFVGRTGPKCEFVCP